MLFTSIETNERGRLRLSSGFGWRAFLCKFRIVSLFGVYRSAEVQGGCGYQEVAALKQTQALANPLLKGTLNEATRILVIIWLTGSIPAGPNFFYQVTADTAHGFSGLRRYPDIEMCNRCANDHEEAGR